MKLPRVWWKVPRPIRRVLCEFACFVVFILVLVPWFVIAGIGTGVCIVLGAFAEAYHEWQFGRVKTGLKARHEHDGQAVEIVGRARNG